MRVISGRIGIAQDTSLRIFLRFAGRESETSPWTDFFVFTEGEDD